MNYAVINFYSITNVRIIWGINGIVEKIEFTADEPFMPEAPLNIKRIIAILDNYYDYCSYDIDTLLPLDRFSLFYQNVYKTLVKIPSGSTITYSELARMAGYPEAFRAVGTAMAKNRYPLIIPCHRVVGKNSIGGFSPDISLKIKLLENETGRSAG
jgi:methylated-DNA-[protein]-cysteine S-methyltransferase